MEQIKKPIIIKDLGLLYAHPTSRDKKRYLLIECPTCFERRRKIAYHVESGCNTECRSCTRKRTNKKHGCSKARIYRIWQGMKNRCSNTKMEGYKNYGGRGINVCAEWRTSFESFQCWALKNGYKSNLSIDRKNNDGNYEPSNCRFTTRTVQARNTRKIYAHNTSGYRGVCFDKEKKKWQSSLGINYKTVNIGRFDSKEKAAKAYDAYVVEHKLEHTLNFEKATQ